MRDKSVRVGKILTLGIVTVCLCPMLCGCGKPSPHSKRSLEAFVEKIDEDATLDYESQEALPDERGGETYIEYRYDAEIGGIDCYVVDRYYWGEFSSDSYEIETDYTYRLCAELWDDVREDYPNVGPLEEDDDYGETTNSMMLGLVGEPTKIKGQMCPGRIFLVVHEGVIDEDVFDEYWDFYCDLIDAMEDYPEFGKVILGVYEGGGGFDKYFKFTGTNDADYDLAYEKFFEQ